MKSRNRLIISAHCCFSYGNQSFGLICSGFYIKCLCTCSPVCLCTCSNVYLFFGNTFFSKSTFFQVKKVPRGSKWIAEFWNLGEIHILRKMSEKVKNGPQNRVFQFRLKMVENESSCGLFFSCGSFLWFFWFNENQDPEKFLVANQIKVFFDPQYL